MENKEYEDWLNLRGKSKENDDEPGFGLCYCGHTKFCECSNPDVILFNESVERGTIIIGEPNNGWKNLED
jgi:hypothetical protein